VLNGGLLRRGHYLRGQGLYARVAGEFLGQLVAGHAHQFILLAEALNFVMGGFHIGVGQHQDPQLVAALDVGDFGALFVEQVGGHFHRGDGADFGARLLLGLVFHQAQDGQGEGAGAADGALAAAAGADLEDGLLQGGAQPLAGHLQKAEAGDAAHLDPGAVQFEGLAHAVFHLPLVLGGGHVDEIDDDQPPHVPQAQLAGDLVRGFQVGLGGGLLDVAALGGAGGVDVDGDQGLGDVDDDGAAGGELDLPHEGGLDLVLDLVAVEQRDAALVELDLAGAGRHHLLDEGGGEVVGLAAVDDHLADVGAQVVADGADDDVAFLEQKVGGGGGVRLGLDGVPQLQQVVEVPLQLLGGAADAGGAHDGAHAVGDFQLPQGLPQLAALIPLDATGDAAGAWI